MSVDSFCKGYTPSCRAEQALTRHLQPEKIPLYRFEDPDPQISQLTQMLCEYFRREFMSSVLSEVMQSTMGIR